MSDKAKTITEKALEVIEVFATPDIMMSNQKRLEKIYKLAHAARGTCGNPHTDWIKEIESDYKAFKKMGLL